MASKMDNLVLEAMKANAPLNFETATAIADRFGLKARSVVASAIRNGIPYLKKAKVSKAGLPITSKEDLIESIANKIGVAVASLEGLEKASKSALLILDAKLYYAEDETEEETA